jgi:uncharacterized protein with PhoU and TrkA domain
VDDYAEAVRRDRYDTSASTPTEQDALDHLMQASNAPGIAWFRISAGSSLIDQPLSEVRLNTNRDARIIAVLRDGQLLPHPDPTFRLRVNDLVSVISNDTASGDATSTDNVEPALRHLKEAPNLRAQLVESDSAKNPDKA